MNKIGQTQIIECNADGEQLSQIEKFSAHIIPGKLHRAFSVILIDEKGRIILQKRSMKKMLWPGIWSNSCCSHYRNDSNRIEEVERRITEELGCKAADLNYITQFQYHARYLDIGVEKELCDIWLGKAISLDVCENPEEVDAVAFLSPTDLDSAISAKSSSFSPWFTLEWPIVFSKINLILNS